MIDKVKVKRERFEKAKNRSKKHLKIAEDACRIVVFKSNKYLYAQIVDAENRVLGCVSSISKELKDKKLGKNIGSAEVIGQALAEKIKSLKVKKVVFDRNGYRYHGKVKALADACRKAGIQF